MADHEIGAILTLRDNMSATLRGVRREQSAFRQDARETQETMREPMDFRVNVASAASAIAGIGLAVGAVALAAGGLAVSFGDDLQKSLNGVQSATGATDEVMAGMEDTLLAIYNNNFGENFEEIGAAMSLVNQQTGLTEGALQGVTENALAIKDTFGIEVADSIKGANQLMKQFGMDGTAAYNLIAQGAQGGLDANGDLVDTLREYSGTFAAQGFSAEEMFDMLSNASKSGIRDLDLAADAIKEFGIRSVDGSSTSAAGFEALGLNAASMTKAFATGGDEAKAAFTKTTTALLAMKNPVEQNAAGVALFGTQFEDMGIKGITALVNTKGAIDETTDALGKINAVKYNTFGEAMEGIKRKLLTGLLLPLDEKITPSLNAFAGLIDTNMPEIQNEIEYAFNVAGDAIGSVGDTLQETKDFFSDHWSVVSPILGGIAAGAGAYYLITGATKAWSAATKLAAIAQTGLNIAMNLSPMGKTIAVVSLLVAAGIALYQNWDTVSSVLKNTWIDIGNFFKTGVNEVIGLVNKLIDGINLVKTTKLPHIETLEMTAKPIDRAGFAALKGDNIDGTLATGLDYVPFDGYIAKLHKGERVQTASENPYNGGSGSSGTKSSSRSISIAKLADTIIVREEADIDKIVDRIMIKVDEAAVNTL